MPYRCDRMRIRRTPAALETVVPCANASVESCLPPAAASLAPWQQLQRRDVEELWKVVPGRVRLARSPHLRGGVLAITTSSPLTLFPWMNSIVLLVPSSRLCRTDLTWQPGGSTTTGFEREAATVRAQSSCPVDIGDTDCGGRKACGRLECAEDPRRDIPEMATDMTCNDPQGGLSGLSRHTWPDPREFTRVPSARMAENGTRRCAWIVESRPGASHRPPQVCAGQSAVLS